MSEINYDQYYSKHCVRYFGWLRASKKLKKEVGNKSLKYFTLCAKEAIDIFMLECEGVLSRDKNEKLPDVIICEKEPRDAAEILNLVRPPQKEAIFVGELEKILTFRDTTETETLSPDMPVRDRRIRSLLRLKDLSERFKKCFPFDIINFDPYGNLLNPGKTQNKLYQCLDKIFELQKGIDTFLLFLTTPIFNIHMDSKSLFKKDFEVNVSSYEAIRHALHSLMGTTSYDEIEEKKKIAISVAKSVIIPIAKKNGWNHKHHGIFVYDNFSGNKMLSSVVQFNKGHSSLNNAVYIDDIVRIIHEMPEYYSLTDAARNGQVKSHLKKIVEYREKARTEFSE